MQSETISVQPHHAAAAPATSPGNVPAFEIIRAGHFGFCFGVRDAIAIAKDVVAHEPVTVLGDLVHNSVVAADLRALGIRTDRDSAQVTTRTVMVTAHGASDRRMAWLRQHGYRVVDASCPLVQAAHRAVLRLEREGFFPVVVGLSGHVEVLGLTEDLAAFSVVLDIEDLASVPDKPRYGVVAQTTQPIERVRDLANRLRRRFPAAEVRLVDTVCQPTKLRQHAAVGLARQCDVVVVVGGARSNNTRELVATCQRHGARAYQVEEPGDLQPGWFAAARRVGLTSGTSTPDAQMEAVEQRLRDWSASLTGGSVPPPARPRSTPPRSDPCGRC